MSGTRVSESAVEEATEQAGQRLAGRLAGGEGPGPRADWAWQPDARGRTVAYVSIDSTGVRQQGPGGAAAEGRMAYVGMVFNPVPDPERVFGTEPGLPRQTQARYVSGLYALEEMGPRMRRLGACVGMDRAEVWVGLCDGGAGLEEFLLSNFPRVEVVILDYWHAAGYLAELAQAAHGDDEGQREAFRRRWCQLLLGEGGAVTSAALREYGRGERRLGVRRQLAVIEEYFGKRLHQMDYPEYEARGWYIGSGAVESACKTVVGQRLKLAGMRWGEAGSHGVCHLRALYRSEKGQWEAFWERPPTL